MNNYVIHTCIKCSDGKDHRLSYDLGSSKQTDEGMREIGRIFEEIEMRFPDTKFWIQKWVDGNSEMIHEPKENTDNEV